MFLLLLTLSSKRARADPYALAKMEGHEQKKGEPHGD